MRAEWRVQLPTPDPQDYESVSVGCSVALHSWRFINMATENESTQPAPVTTAVLFSSSASRMVFLSPAYPQQRPPQRPLLPQGPTWPSACAPSARARPPRSSTHCGCCPFSGPQLQSQPGTGPWSCWCCFLHRSRERVVTSERDLVSHSRTPGASRMMCPGEAGSTPQQYRPFPTLLAAASGRGPRKATRKGRRAGVLHVLLRSAGGSGAQQARP